jgi:hypothetical protein
MAGDRIWACCYRLTQITERGAQIADCQRRLRRSDQRCGVHDESLKPTLRERTTTFLLQLARARKGAVNAQECAYEGPAEAVDE